MNVHPAQMSIWPLRYKLLKSLAINRYNRNAANPRVDAHTNAPYIHILTQYFLIKNINNNG